MSSSSVTQQSDKYYTSRYSLELLYKKCAICLIVELLKMIAYSSKYAPNAFCKNSISSLNSHVNVVYLLNLKCYVKAIINVRQYHLFTLGQAMAESRCETEEISLQKGQISSCRTCMGDVKEFYNLCVVEYKHLFDLLNNLLGFEAKLINEEYIICRKCELTLKQLENFKNTCLKSQENFCNAETNKEELLVEKDIRTYLETALSPENEHCNDEPAIAKNNDSDVIDGCKKRLRRPVRRKSIISSKKSDTTNNRKPRKGKPFVHKQFPANEVLHAIEESSIYITDVKFRTCVLCDFKGADNKSLALHMKYKHDDYRKSWCFRCNVLDYDLKKHGEQLKCFEFACKFCGKDFRRHSRLIEHLRFHCNRTFDSEDSEKLGNLVEVEAVGEEHSNVNEEIITLSLDTVDNVDNGETEQYDKETPLSDSNDSDCTPLIVRLKSNRRLTKRSTRRIKRPGRYKDPTLEDNRHKADEPDENNEANADDPDPDYEEIITINNEMKGRMKCRLKQFDHEEVLQAINDTLKPFKMNRECILCGFVASHARALSVHMTLLHKDIKDNWCSRCNCLVDELAQHSEGHKNDLLKCTFCGRSFNKFFHLKEHLKSHSRLHAYDTDPKWYSCKICPNSYPDEQKLKEHVCKGPDPSFNGKKKKKIKNSRFCVPCNKRVRSLPIHIKHKHNADGKLKEPSNKLCSVCGKTFADNSKLTVHMRIHTGEFPYKCSYCAKRCSTRNHLVVHERTHTGEKPHICYICGKAFAQSSVLGTHMKIHTGRPEQCSVCDQRFCRPAELKLHMRRHTGEKPYLCNNCGLSFHQRSHLVEHVKRHSSDRPYKCSFCEKGFKQISVLKAHENIHTGLKPYKCSQCNYSCRQSYSLTVHMKQHANDAPQPERPHKCLICCKQFSTHAMLMSHASYMHAEIVENEKEFSRIENVMDCS